MTKYRKKPVVIEAVQWNGDNFKELDTFTSCNVGLELMAGGATKLVVNTLEGRLSATVNDWIIKGVQGEFYPCKPDIFEATYEKVED